MIAWRARLGPSIRKYLKGVFGRLARYSMNRSFIVFWSGTSLSGRIWWIPIHVRLANQEVKSFLSHCVMHASLRFEDSSAVSRARKCLTPLSILYSTVNTMSCITCNQSQTHFCSLQDLLNLLVCARLSHALVATAYLAVSSPEYEVFSERNAQAGAIQRVLTWTMINLHQPVPHHRNLHVAWQYR